MKKNLSKTLSLLLASVMIVGSLTACGSNSTTTEETAASEATTEATSEATTGSDTPMVVGSLAFSEKFSPFFAESGYDVDAEGITQVKLATFDRTAALVENAADGQVVPYNGTDYTYNGIANIAVTRDEAADTTTYNFKLRDDVLFSDGTPLTADDLIFSLYVLCDTDYD